MDTFVGAAGRIRTRDHGFSPRSLSEDPRSIQTEPRPHTEHRNPSIRKGLPSLSPGALRMHLLLKADPTKESRYCSSHEECCRAYQEELGLEAIRYLSSLPRVEMETS